MYVFGCIRSVPSGYVNYLNSCIFISNFLLSFNSWLNENIYIFEFSIAYKKMEAKINAGDTRRPFRVSKHF